MTHDKLCPKWFHEDEQMGCPTCDLIARARMDQDNVHAETSDWMRNDAYIKGCVAGLESAAALVENYAEERLIKTRSPNMSEDITAALRTAAQRIKSVNVGDR